MFIIMRSSTIRTGKGNGLRNVITSDTQPRKAKANLNSHMMSCCVGKWLETYLRSHNMYRTLSNILKNRRKWKNIRAIFDVTSKYTYFREMKSKVVFETK